MPKIFVVNNNPEYDYDFLDEIGEPIYMTHGFVPLGRFDDKVKVFKKYAGQFSEGDILLLSGQNILCAVALSTFLRCISNTPIKIMQAIAKRNPDGTIQHGQVSYDVI
jgi:hypothetical protein